LCKGSLGPGDIAMTVRLPLIFILLTVMINSMGIGVILPVMPDLIEEVGGLTLAQAAVWGGVLTSAYAVMQFLFSPWSAASPTGSGDGRSCSSRLR